MNAVVIGAGKTGRGFIAPILQKNHCQITFIDKDEELIAKLNEQGTYNVYYFEDKKEKVTINAYQAYSVSDRNAIKAIRNAEIVFTCVFANNISSLKSILKKGTENRVQKDKLSVICCENGVEIKKPLLDRGIDASITEGIIFCTTMECGNSLDLISETYPEIPIDNREELLSFDLKGLKLIYDYSTLIQRKIYTYNFMSAVIAYLGSYSGYKYLGEAANDTLINYVVETVAPIISSVVGKEYNIAYSEQSEFTNRAIGKFKNKEITDTIERNAAQAGRKLEINERLLKPLELVEKYEKDSNYLLLVIAAAIYYGMNYEGLKKETIFDAIRKITDNSLTIEVLNKNLNYMEKNVPLLKIIRLIDNN